MPIQFYMTMTGAKQGQIQGPVLGGTRGGGWPAGNFEYGVVAPNDLNVGRPIGPRTHGPSGTSAPTKAGFKLPYSTSWLQPVTPIRNSQVSAMIPVINFNYAGENQFVAQTEAAQNSGPAHFGPLKVTRQIDSFSPQLLLAHSTGELFSEVVLVAQMGGATIRKVTLLKAVIIRLSRCLEFPCRTAHRPAQGYQTLELSYAGISST